MKKLKVKLIFFSLFVMSGICISAVPLIISRLDNVSVFAGQTAVFEIRVLSELEVTHLIYHDRSLLNYDEVIVDGGVVRDKYSYTFDGFDYCLMIRNITPSDKGTYDFHFFNRYGYSGISAELNVVEIH